MFKWEISVCVCMTSKEVRKFVNDLFCSNFGGNVMLRFVSHRMRLYVKRPFGRNLKLMVLLHAMVGCRFCRREIFLFCRSENGVLQDRKQFFLVFSNCGMYWTSPVSLNYHCWTFDCPKALLPACFTSKTVSCNTRDEVFGFCSIEKLELSWNFLQLIENFSQKRIKIITGSRICYLLEVYS